MLKQHIHFTAAALLGIERERCADIIREISQEIENTRTTLEMPKGNMRSPDDIQSDVRERGPARFRFAG